MKNLRKGFTLVELLVVIAVIGILFVVLISKVDFATDKAKETGVKTDFRSYELAMEQVAREQTGFAYADATKTADASKIVVELNKNLDKKLRITDDADGTASIAAKDPWGSVYQISFNAAADIDGAAGSATAAAVTVTSYGPDKLAGDAAKDADNITMTTGYGPNGVVSFTSGLSNNLDNR